MDFGADLLLDLPGHLASTSWSLTLLALFSGRWLGVDCFFLFFFFIWFLRVLQRNNVNNLSSNASNHMHNIQME